MPGQTPLSRVDPTTQPVIASIDRSNGKKTVTVEYKDTLDGGMHVVGLPPTSLRSLSDDVLNIGDRVTLAKRGKGVCPSVGSSGTVLGGSGPYTVTFNMDTDPTTGESLDETVTITQSHVPRDVLKFEGEALDDEGGDDGGEEDSDSDSEDSEDDQDQDHDDQDQYYSKSEALMTLRGRLSSPVYDSVVMMLNLEELGELATALEDEGVDVDPSDLNSVLNLL